jgi:hypothetical protein
MAAEMRDMQQRYFTSVFPMIAAQPDVTFFIQENIATSFPPALSRRFRFESLLVRTLRAAKLRSYWKRVFFFITSTILSLRAARKSLLEFQLNCPHDKLQTQNPQAFFFFNFTALVSNQ